MGTVMIPEFLLLGQIVKREEAACSLLQKDDPTSHTKKKKQQQKPSLKSPTSAPHKPSLCSIDEEAAGAGTLDETTAPDEDEEEEAEKEVARHTCGLSLFGFLGPWLSFICPSRR